MKLFDFIRTLSPRIDRQTVVEDIEVTQKEMTTGVIPAYQSAQIFFKASGFQSDEVKSLQTIFYRNYTKRDSKKQENFLAEIAVKLPYVRENLEYIDNQIDDLFSRDIIKEGLTLRKAAMIRAVDHISFMSRYAIDLINLIYVLEAKHRQTDVEVEYQTNAKAQELTQKNLFVFAKMLEVYGMKPDDFKKQFFGLPEAVVNEQTFQHVSALYRDSGDPIPQDAVSGFEGNPIYHIRLNIAEWQADRYKSFKDKKKMLELRLMHLKMLEQDKKDPSLEKEISYIQQRVESIDYKLKKMEDN